jgi:hypothetical protein
VPGHPETQFGVAARHPRPLRPPLATGSHLFALFYFYFFYLNMFYFYFFINIFIFILLKWIRVTILLVGMTLTWRLTESVKF